MRRRDHVALKHLAEFPVGHDVGDATVLVDGADDDLGNQLGIAADQQLAVRENSLIFADVQQTCGNFTHDLSRSTAKLSDKQNTILIIKGNQRSGPRMANNLAHLMLAVGQFNFAEVKRNNTA